MGDSNKCARGLTVFKCWLSSVIPVVFLIILGDLLTDLTQEDNYKAAVIGACTLMLLIWWQAYPAPDFHDAEEYDGDYDIAANLLDVGDKKAVLVDQQNQHRSHYFIHCSVMSASIAIIWFMPIFVSYAIKLSIAKGFLSVFGL